MKPSYLSQMPVASFALVCFSLLSISIPAHAEADGGSDRGGGNVCWISKSEVKTLDEVQFSNGIFTSGKGQKLRTAKSLMYGNKRISLADIGESEAGKNVSGKLNQFSKTNPLLGSILIRAARALQSTVVMKDVRNTEPYRAAYKSGSLCGPSNTQATFVTVGNYTAIISKIWNRLSLQSQEILLIHELLRIGQVRYNYFLNSAEGDLALQEIAVAIYENPSRDYGSHQFFDTPQIIEMKKTDQQRLAEFYAPMDQKMAQALKKYCPVFTTQPEICRQSFEDETSQVLLIPNSQLRAFVVEKKLRSLEFRRKAFAVFSDLIGLVGADRYEETQASVALAAAADEYDVRSSDMLERWILASSGVNSDDLREIAFGLENWFLPAATKHSKPMRY